MTDITLETGQTARIEAGIMRVTSSAPPPAAWHYRMTTQHETGGLLDARCTDFQALTEFLRQLGPLGYALRNIVRVEGI